MRETVTRQTAQLAQQQQEIAQLRRDVEMLDMVGAALRAHVRRVRRVAHRADFDAIRRRIVSTQSIVNRHAGR